MPNATLIFLGPADWRNIQQGEIRAGEKLTIRIQSERVPFCRGTPHQPLAWTITGYVKFHPGEQFYNGSMVEEVRNPPGPEGRVVWQPPQPFTVDVPEGSTSVEVWFGNSDETGCIGWDSNNTLNYRFNVTP